MSVTPHQPRHYRHHLQSDNLVSYNVTVKETDLYIRSSHPLEKRTRDLILHYRGQLEAYIHQNPGFATTLAPWPARGPMVPIVRDMVAAGQRAGVGPMAAVAGAISQYVGRDLLDDSDQVIVENGGDVFIKTAEPVTVAIFAGRSPLSMQLGLKIRSRRHPMAVCTSSGTVGHSLSLGHTDAVCVVSSSCALADAAATSIGNHIQIPGDIQAGIEFGKAIHGVAGLLVIAGDQIGAWGEVELVPLQGKKGLSFQHEKSK